MPTKPFQPDYRNLVDAARRKRPTRLPLYEHNVYPNVLEAATGISFAHLRAGDATDQREYFRRYAQSLASLGYDVVPFEGCVTELVQGGEALCGRAPALFSSVEEIERWPWDDFQRRYFERFGASFEALAESLPPGMKAVAGVGNGVFETIQDFVPLTELAYLEADDPDAYALLWQKVADLLVATWRAFLGLADDSPRTASGAAYGDAFCLLRMGDDLGFKSSLLLRPETIRQHIIPAYARVTALARAVDKPFLLHSCGCIFDVMEDLLTDARIDAKHSNEDQIAPFADWLERYGDRIALFGGIDMDFLCRESPQAIGERVREVIRAAAPYPGFALGSGNQIAEYVPPEGFLAMVNAVRECRGDY